MNSSDDIRGRLVLDDRVAAGRIRVQDGHIVAVDLDERGGEAGGEGDRALPFVTPGFVDVHVHGWGGHDAMGSPQELDGMAQALLAHGVTSFLPTAVSSPVEELGAFADRVRRWMPAHPADGARPLGFNLEGPFLAQARRGAHNPLFLRDPADVDTAALEPLLDGLRVTTIAPELPGALELIGWMHGRGVVVSLGHSGTDLATARAGYAAGARTTTHLFNAMTGVDHRAPGLAVAGLVNDEAFVELIADGHHVDVALWPIITRTKPSARLLLVSDPLALAGAGDGRMTIGGLEVDVRDGKCTLVESGALAGSVIALDTAVRNLVRSGVDLPAAVEAASRNPLRLLGIEDRGRVAVGQAADLVELDDDLRVARVMRDGRWYAGSR
ncbi:MAG: N-acetylglucosamine-6-phosphate deacetylase [Chloroflexi bacterium]|nr:MAG: N-acetylglucosamine-6-phosphate deacetylase [Chloroflexota bacterium]